MLKKNRNYSLDYLRLLATFMVVLLHVQLFGGLLSNKVFTLDFLPTIVLESLCIVAVNCFVLITGFFMIHKQINWEKIINLLLEIAFISWFIFLIGVIFGLKAPLKELIQHILPTLSGCHWFVSSYIIVYILSPWLNKFIISLTYKECLFVAILGFIIFSIWSINPKINFISVYGGYSILWLAYIYFIGSIISLHMKSIKNSILLYILSSLATVVYAIILCKYSHDIMYAMNYNSPFILIASIALFYIFLQVKEVNKDNVFNKIINFLTPGCFGVFLIHTDLFVRPFYPLLFQYYKSYPVWLITIASSFIIFAGSLLISVYIQKTVIFVNNNCLFPFFEKRVIHSNIVKKLLEFYNKI